MAESLGYSVVSQYGYGMGEAVLESYRRHPRMLRPYIDRALTFTSEQLRGEPEAGDLHAAVGARNALLSVVRDIIADDPKSDAARG